MSDLQQKIAQELHRPARRKFNRRKYILKGIKDLIQIDLIELPEFARANNGYRYILIAINCFSRYAFAEPLKTKTGKEVERKLARILVLNKGIKNVQSDLGREFYNKDVKQLFDRLNINHYSVFSEIKAAFVERLNRTLKSRLYERLTANGTQKWLNILPDIVYQYNNTIHSAIGMTPASVRRRHEKHLIMLQLKKKSKQSPSRTVYRPKFAIGDVVRISKFRQVFDKSFRLNWSPELFIIHGVFPTQPPTYVIRDLNNEIIQGRFYSEQLMKTNLTPSEQNTYLVERIIRKSNNKYLVKWLGFDKTSWIDKSDIITPSVKQKKKNLRATRKNH